MLMYCLVHCLNDSVNSVFVSSGCQYSSVPIVRDKIEKIVVTSMKIVSHFLIFCVAMILKYLFRRLLDAVLNTKDPSPEYP